MQSLRHLTDKEFIARMSEVPDLTDREKEMLLRLDDAVEAIDELMAYTPSQAFAEAVGIP